MIYNNNDPNVTQWENELQQPQDTSTPKDELGITVMSITIQETDKLTYPFDLYDNNGKCVAVIPWGINRKLPETMAEVKRNTEKIRTAVNSTYGKGYNPAAMEELYKALGIVTEKLRLSLEYWKVTKDGDNFLQSEYEDNMSCYGAVHNANKILENAKTIKP